MKNLVISLSNSSAASEPGGLGTKGWISYVVLGLILVIMIGYILYKIIKHYVTKHKKIKKLKKQSNVNKELYREYVISINEIIEYTDSEVKNFQVSVGDHKMGEVKAGAKKLITTLYNREDFKDFKESDKYQDFVKNIETLQQTNANIWQRACAKEVAYFKRLQKDLEHDDLYETYQRNVQESIREKFYEK